MGEGGRVGDGGRGCEQILNIVDEFLAEGKGGDARRG